MPTCFASSPAAAALNHLPAFARRSRLLALTALLLLPAAITPTARAQEIIPPVDQAAQFIGADVRSQIVSLEPSEDLSSPVYAPATEGDEDIGVQVLLRPRQRYRPFTLWAEPAVYWTSNAALTDSSEREDVYFTGFLGAAYTPRIKGNLFGNVLAYQRFYRYDDNSFLDFNSTEAGAGLTNVFPNLGNLSLYGRYNYERLIEAREQTEIFTEHSFILGLYKPFLLGPKSFAYARARTLFSLGTNPDLLRSHQYSATVGYRYTIIDPLKFEMYYRARFRNYRNLTGDDMNHQIGGYLYYDFNETIRLIASASVAFNDSSRFLGDYTASNLGGALSLQFKF